MGAQHVPFHSRPTLPTGELGANDTQKLHSDHAGLMSRVSVAPFPTPAQLYPQPGSLDSDAARSLQLCAVQKASGCFEPVCSEPVCAADPACAVELRAFLGHALVCDFFIWRALFRVKRVPRGVVTRIARHGQLREALQEVPYVL